MIQPPLGVLLPANLDAITGQNHPFLTRIRIETIWDIRQSSTANSISSRP